jgi:amino acid adenylation domain-containing protein
MIQIEDYNISPVTGLVFESVRKFPDNPALELNDRIFTYRELYEAARGISKAIIDKNDPNPFVALVADKSFTCYAGILGILMAGKAYMPLNPKFPLSRNQYMLEKAGIRTIIPGEFPLSSRRGGQGVRSEKGLPGGKGVRSEKGVGSENAYLLFTSGTTGQPKGVPVSHANLGAYLDFMLKTYAFSPADRFTQIFDLTFDLSVHDIFLAWSSGACLVVPDDNSSFAMSRFIKEKQPSVWFSVPSVVNLMDKMRLLKPGAFPSIRMSFFCGEALHVKTATAWKNAVPQSRMINLYGPTEATIAISGYELPNDNRQCKSDLGIVSIGKIFKGNSFNINKENHADDHGELCLSGAQVVEGYLDNDQADQEAFFSDPVTGQKVYRTGDIVRADAEGDLFYLGRKDSEVKISGYRVNLKEIESVIEGYENMRQAVVIYDQPDNYAEMIIAFVLAEFKNEKITGKDLDDYCRSRLPWYMVPGKFIFVNEIPLNVNGKVDKTALKTKYAPGI